MAAPSMTFNSAGNVRPSSTLAAGATANYVLDYSTKIEGQVTIKNTPGGTVSGTRGLRVRFLARYAASAQWNTIPAFSFDFPSAVASVEETKTFFLGTGRWVVSVVNLDVAQAITVEITDATVDGIS